MLNIFDTAAATMRNAVKDQTDKLLADIELAMGVIVQAGIEFDTEMSDVHKAMAELNDREQIARQNLTKAILKNQVIMISIQKQINEGEMVTGGETIDQPHSNSDERRDSMPINPKNKLRKDRS